MIRAVDSKGMLRPDEIEDAIAFGAARLADTPLDQLQTEAAAYRASRGLSPRAVDDAADMAALADALGIDRWVVEGAMVRAGGNVDVFMRILDVDPETMEAALSQVLDPDTLAVLDAIAYGIAKLLHTPLGQLKAEADAYRGHEGRPIVGSKAGTWANQALDYALNTDSPYVATAYMKPPPGHIYDLQSRWTVYTMHTRQALDDWYGSIVGASERYHYVAAFDKTSPEWIQGKPVAVAVGDSDAYVGNEGERHMTYAGSNPYVGADDGSYPEVAAHAVQGVHQQTPSPIYGYLRTGMQQKIYLFPTLEQGSGWFTTIVHGQQPYGYAAVFAATDLSRPVPNLESFGHTVVSGYTPASDAELVNRATDDQFFAMYPDRRGRRLDQNDPADRALIPVWQDLHRKTAARAQELALAGDTSVGQFWPFLLGLPLGGLAGYFLRRWQEQNPGQTLPGVPPGKLPAPNIPPPPPPKTSGDYVGGPWLDIESAPYVGGPWLDIESAPYVGGPWLDIESAPYVGGPWLDIESAPYVGGPWLDMVGATYGSSPYERPYHGDPEAERRRRWPQTKALIEVAKREARDSNATYPAAALVWSLDPTGVSTTRAQLMGGETFVVPFSSYAQALDYMRSRIQTPHVALALFDTASPHWPNPVNWTKSDDPAYEAIIADRISMSSPRMAGDYGGTSIGSALDDVRRKAESLAARRAGNVIGVIHTPKDDSWHSLAFHSADDADDWITTATQDPALYTYAAYFDKQGDSWPHAYIEKISGMRAPPGTELPRRTVSGGWRHRGHGWAA